MPITASGGIQDVYRLARSTIVSPKESEIVLTVPAGTPRGAQLLFQVTHEEAEKALIVSYFDLTIPEEFEGNIILETELGYTVLREPNQQPGTTEFYDPSDYGLRFFYVKSFYLFAKCISNTTDDRTIRLKFGCGRRAEL